MPKGRSTLLGALARAHQESNERVVVLTCMDLQPGDQVSSELIRQGQTGHYDHLSLAGSALGAVTSRFPHWGRTFYEHLALARALHGVTRVILMDHRNCSTYQQLLGLGLEADSAHERDVHLAHLQKLRRKIHALDSTLQIHLWLLGADGGVEDLSEAPDLWLPGVTERRRNPRARKKKARATPRKPARGRARARR